jgi:hypothetical protein
MRLIGTRWQIAVRFASAIGRQALANRSAIRQAIRHSQKWDEERRATLSALTAESLIMNGRRYCLSSLPSLSAMHFVGSCGSIIQSVLPFAQSGVWLTFPVHL